MKKIKKINTYFVNEETSEEGVISVIEERDEQENITLLEQYTVSGEIEQRIERLYDNENRLLEEKQYASQFISPDQHIKCSYNESGKLSQRAIHYSDGSISFWNYAYDEKENSFTIEVKDEEEYLEGKEYRRLDSEGKLLEEAIYGEEGVFEHQIQTSYDDHGRVIEQEVKRGEEEAVKQFYDYEIDEEGRVKSVEIYDKDDEVLRYDEVSYDENGNRKEMKMESFQQGWSVVHSWEYNEKGEVTKEQQAQPNGLLLEESEYRRDANNLIVEKETRGGNGVSLLKYVYEFYE